MFDSDYRLKILLIFAFVYFGAHVITGFHRCSTGFCPGDNEKEWVYEYTDANGKTYIIIDGETIPVHLYKEFKKVKAE